MRRGGASPADVVWMEAALRLAMSAAVRGEVPVGALVVRDGKVIAQAHNEMVQRKDPTAHAEVLALRVAVIKCHARGNVDPNALHLRADGKERARLSFSAEWAAAHPRTLYLLEQEVEAWSKSGAYGLTLRASVEDWT